jgi:hypothetical protein
MGNDLLFFICYNTGLESYLRGYTYLLRWHNLNASSICVRCMSLFTCALYQYPPKSSVVCDPTIVLSGKHNSQINHYKKSSG